MMWRSTRDKTDSKKQKLDQTIARARRRVSGPLALAAVTLVTVGAGCRGKYVREVTAERLEATPERLLRGSYIVNQLAACGACHTTRATGHLATESERTDAFLGGGNLLAAEGLGEVWVPNITPDLETGVGGWSDDELMRAIRDGVTKDGRFMLPVMPFNGYQVMSDEDVRATVVYLRSVPPFRQPKPRAETRLSLLPRVLFTTLGVQMHEPARAVPAPAADPVRTGEYLSRIAACSECHSLTKKGPRKPTDPQYLSGSEGPFTDAAVGRVWARNLTPDQQTGLGRFRAEAIKEAIRTGVRLDKKRMAPPMSLFVPHYSGIAEEDLDAIVAFLKSVKAVPREVPERELSAEGQRLVERGLGEQGSAPEGR
jgi:mono/diheme cytochrome c family protein